MIDIIFFVKEPFLLFVATLLYQITDPQIHFKLV